MTPARLSIFLLLATSSPIFAQDAPTPDPSPVAPKGGEAPKAGEGVPKAGEGDPKAGEDAAETPEERKARRREEIKKRREENRGAQAAKKEGRPLAPDDPIGQALDEKFNVPTLYASDGTVRLAYSFKDVAEQGDFELRGFDAAESAVGGRGFRARRRAQRLAEKGNNKNLRFELVAGSKGAVALHKLHLKDDFKITIHVHVIRSTNRSDLVFFVDKGGARFGSQPVLKSGSGFRAVAKVPVVKDAFEGGKQVALEIVGKDGTLTTKINGVAVASSKKFSGKLDGPFGIYAKDIVVQLQSVEIQGLVDAKKMKLK